MSADERGTASHFEDRLGGHRPKRRRRSVYQPRASALDSVRQKLRRILWGRWKPRPRGRRKFARAGPDSLRPFPAGSSVRRYVSPGRTATSASAPSAILSVYRGSSRLRGIELGNRAENFTFQGDQCGTLFAEVVRFVQLAQGLPQNLNHAHRPNSLPTCDLDAPRQYRVVWKFNLIKAEVTFQPCEAST